MQKKIAIVGAGPRGLAVLERIAVMQIANPCKLEVIVIDDVELGVGRIWRTDQDEGFLMNTVPGQISMFSGEADESPWRPGAGPSLAQWLLHSSNPEWAALGPNDYAPRYAYGYYLKNVYSIVVQSLRNNASVREILGRASELEKIGDRYALKLEDGSTISDLTSVVLATGHPKAKVADWERECIDFAERSQCRFIRGDSAADMPLEAVEAQSWVGVIGMGLGFYDTVSALTEGRGGIFTRKGGCLTYQPSGKEPFIVAGSRSGLPQPARGRNQKTFGSTYSPIFFNQASIIALQAYAHAKTGSSVLNFRADLLPLIQTEMEHIYYSGFVRERFGQEQATKFARIHAETRNPNKAIPKELLDEFGISDIRPLDIWRLARPFQEATFGSHDVFSWELATILRLDLAEANTGNISSPLKAALDVIRDVRDTIRSSVEHGGLTSKSMQDDFLGDFAPISALLAAGPPAFRIDQLLALMKVGIVRIAGPATKFECDPANECFIVSSPVVHGAAWPVRTLIDSRIPTPGFAGTESTLFRSLEQQNLARTYQGPTNDPFGANWDGGVDVTPSPFLVKAADGSPLRGLYMLGIPTERPRWFTQVGSGTPGTVSRFTLDAMAIADSIFSDDQGVVTSVDSMEEAL